jgi:hypothetical protein
MAAAASFCSLYSQTGTVWPRRDYPAYLFPRWSHQRHRHAAEAWQFFERVEATDAATRVRYSLIGGWQPPTSVREPTHQPWFVFQTAGDLDLYKEGKYLHQLLCPATDWTAQRDLGIPPTPLTNVYPGSCPTVSEGPPIGIEPCPDF